MSQHEIVRCRRCGAVVRQCRCPGPHAVTFVDGPCAHCHGKTGFDAQALYEKANAVEKGAVAPRQAKDVVQRVLDVVPEDQTALRVALRSVLHTAMYSAPESEEPWRLLEKVLMEMLGAPSEDLPADAWQVRVGRIVRAEE